MLTSPQRPLAFLRRPGGPLLLILLTCQLAAAPRVHSAEGRDRLPAEARPEGFVLLTERTVAGGQQVVGLYGAQADPAEPGLWRIKVWDELPNDVKVRTETIRCSLASPMRITSDGRQLIVRQLNPGGAITPSNRLDHLIWWATCVPELAGRDPATLAAEARRRGYDGHRSETEERLALPGRL